MTNAQQQQLTIEFTKWFNDGNVRLLDGGFATQDAQWGNRLTLEELREYFEREFYGIKKDSELVTEIKTSGEWLEVPSIHMNFDCENVYTMYVNCEDGRITDMLLAQDGDVYDTNITDANGVEYLEQMSAEDLRELARYFPSTIEKFKMMQIREKAEWLLLNTFEGMDNTEERVIREIISLTK